MTLAIFDLDNTLIGGDSDHLWAVFAHENGLSDDPDFAARADRFYADYAEGNLDILAYLRFALSPLVGQPPEVLDEWHRQFMADKIEPIMQPRAAALLDEHRERGHQLIVITATNHFITRPIVDALGIEHLLACEGEIIDGRYTGEPSGVPSFHKGKVTRLEQWLQNNNETLAGAWFYSDSHNDLPLLEKVDNPVAVDPDEKLLARARAMDWPVISLRD